MPAKLTAILAGVLGLMLMGAAQADVRLPQLGEPADAAMSPRDEAEIGRNLMRQALASPSVDRDPQVAAYIQSLGQNIASHTAYRPIDGYTFFVIHENRINAFAAPGGYMAVFTGLIREAENEAQLAGVIAHEIAHVSQRHIARSVAAQQENMPITIAQIIAGILIGTVNPQAGQAAVVTGMAGSVQDRLDFSRSAEQEADRIGIRLLAEAGFHPEGMAEFFEILMRQERGAVNAPPEYLRTHPLSSNRVSEARDRARALVRDGMRRDSLDFQLMRTRLEAVDTSDPNSLRQRWANDGPHQDPNREAARQYGLALLDLERDQHAAAADRIADLRAERRDNLHLLILAAQAARAQGQYDQAEEHLRQALDLHPSAWTAVQELGEMLRQKGEPARAAGVLSRFVRMEENYPPSLWRDLARAREEAGQPIASREALAQWHTKSFRYSEAIRQLEMGLEQAQEGSNDEKRLRARLQEVRSAQKGRLANDPLSDN